MYSVYNITGFYMIGLRKINDYAAIKDYSHIVKVPMKDGTTALMQLNKKKQQLDCVVINDKQYITEEHTVKSKGKYIMPAVYEYLNMISKSFFFPKDKPKITIELIEKSIQ